MSAAGPSDLPGAGPGSAIARIMLGSELRQHREAAGVTPESAAWHIRASRAKISRMENGRQGFKDRDVRDLLEFYGVTDPQVMARVLALAGQARAADWVAERPAVNLQILPFSAGGHDAGGTFMILRFAEPGVADVVYSEQLTGATYLDKPGATDHYLDIMNRLGVAALSSAETVNFLQEIIREI